MSYITQYSLYKLKTIKTQAKNIHFIKTHTTQNICIKSHDFYGNGYKDKKQEKPCMELNPSIRHVAYSTFALPIISGTIEKIVII